MSSRPLRSVEWARLCLPQRPTSQKDGKGEGGEDHHGSRHNQRQQEGNLVRLANPRVLVSVHLPASLLNKREYTISSYAYRD